MRNKKIKQKNCENCGKKGAKNTNANIWLCDECYWIAKREFPKLH